MVKTFLKINGIIAVIVIMLTAAYYILNKTSAGVKIAANLGYGKAQYKLASSAAVKKDEEEAFRWYKKAAENNYPPAYFMLGRRYATGTGTKQNYSEAMTWFKKSDESRASYEIGKIYYYGYGRDHDYVQAIKYFNEAAERLEHNNAKNKMSNCSDYVYTRLGKMYYEGQGVKQDFEEAVKYFNKNSNHPENAFYLGKIYYENNVRHNKNPAEIAEYFNKSADFLALDLATLGETLNGGTYKEWLPDWAFNAAEGQLYVGEIAYKAAEETLDNMKKGIKNEYTNKEAYETYSDAAKKRFQIFSDINCDIMTGDEYAEKLLNLSGKQGKNDYSIFMKEAGLKDNSASKTQACKALRAKSHLNIGIMYYYGIGYGQDYNNAIKYFTKAAKYGNANAEFNLGIMYYNGYGTPKDLSAGLTLIESAAQKGYIYATKALADIYMEKKNYAKAFSLYNQAVQSGYSKAKTNIAQMYEEGLGVAKDRKKALEWYEEASKDGNSEAMQKAAYMNLSDKNYDKAKDLFEKLYENGNARAAYEIGNMYSYGWGVSENDDEAREWYKKAADGKNINAIAMILLLDQRKYGKQFFAEHKEYYAEYMEYIIEMENQGKINFDKITMMEYVKYQNNKYTKKRASVYNDCMRNAGDHSFCVGLTNGIIGGF